MHKDAVLCVIPEDMQKIFPKIHFALIPQPIMGKYSNIISLFKDILVCNQKIYLQS